MKARGTTQRTQTLYATAWRQTGPGILVALMFVMVASAAMLRAQTAESTTGFASPGSLTLEHALDPLQSTKSQTISHSVELELPLRNLRDAEGRMTPNSESFFLLLARRAKSQSLSVMLTINSIDEAEFATALAARIMREVTLDPAQMRISVGGYRPNADTSSDPWLTVTITRHETLDGDFE